MKSFVIAAMLSFSLPVLASSDHDDHYVMSMEDIALLDRLEQPEPGYDYARCRNNDCYIVTTGERIGNGPDGIYMVWATNEKE